MKSSDKQKDDEMNVEDKYKEIMARFRTDSAVMLNEVMRDIHSDLMPYIETDNVCNVQTQAQEAVINLIAGSFTKTDTGVVVNGRDGNTFEINITANQWDSVRKSLIKAMPECPKDLEIKALKEHINFLNEATECRY